ncbi:multiubiquitin domain-containing protein [Streptomyces sp. ISL-99]|uniref:multiubiquitin domain-containing protein n=1 Tax=Streptomyces sp. ISL-99 TaxID=2819193 RepID=UPI001BE50DC7|nr:multiubiquitin domain-containing protein [Streptomyces sp. ISL-99]MBT2530429.1 multiubiquitin domain-containing protein [Streptomyces sp. ISL-99]
MNRPLDPASPGRVRLYKIVVNGQERTVDSGTLSFDEVVRLAFDPVPTGPYVLITVGFRHADQKPAQGTLTAGNSVKIKNRTVLNVTATDKS